MDSVSKMPEIKITQDLLKQPKKLEEKMKDFCSKTTVDYVVSIEASKETEMIKNKRIKEKIDLKVKEIEEYLYKNAVYKTNSNIVAKKILMNILGKLIDKGYRCKTRYEIQCTHKDCKNCSGVPTMYCSHREGSLPAKHDDDCYVLFVEFSE